MVMFGRQRTAGWLHKVKPRAPEDRARAADGLRAAGGEDVVACTAGDGERAVERQPVEKNEGRDVGHGQRCGEDDTVECATVDKADRRAADSAGNGSPVDGADVQKNGAGGRG